MIMESHLSIAKREAKEKGLVFFPHHETNMSQVIRDAKSLDEAVEYLFGYVTNIRNMYNSEIQTLRDKVASAEVLVEALRFYADKSSYDCDHDIGMEVSHRVILYKDQYEHNQSTYYAGRRAIEALATYNKLSEVKHDTE